MSTQNARLLDSKSVQSIMSKRKPLKATDAGENIVLTIKGDGNVIDVTNKDGDLVTSTIAGFEGTVLQKKIFNTNFASQIAMNNPRARQFMIDGLKAEKAGDLQKAHELYNNYLNATQVSFGLLLPSATADLLRKGSRIAAEVIVVTTENGSLLTIDPSTIMIEEAKKVTDSVNFDVSHFVEEEKTPAAPATPATGTRRRATAK